MILAISGREYALWLELAFLNKTDRQQLALGSHAGFVSFDRCIAPAQYHRIAHANAMRLIIGDGYLRQAFQRCARIDEERIHHREALGQPLIGAILALLPQSEQEGGQLPAPRV